MAICVGSKAPDFVLKSMTADGTKDVKLSDNFGKSNTVLLFFPGAFTGPCTTELCGVSGELRNFEESGAVVYGISVDTPFAQDGWAKANDIRVQLLSDFAKNVVADYDLDLPDFAGLGASVSKRAVVIIDKEGIVSYVQVTPTPGDLPDFDEVKATLKSLSKVNA